MGEPPADGRRGDAGRERVALGRRMGRCAIDNIVWGSSSADNIVWGSTAPSNAVVWSDAPTGRFWMVGMGELPGWVTDEQMFKTLAPAPPPSGASDAPAPTLTVTPDA